MTIAVDPKGGASRVPRRLYVSGPMTGIPEFNYPAFIEAAAQLRAAGYDVVSPVELDAEARVDLANFGPADYRAALARDAAAVIEADGVALLGGWRSSRGARAEVALADAVRIPVYRIEAWLATSQEKSSQ